MLQFIADEWEEGNPCVQADADMLRVRRGGRNGNQSCAPQIETEWNRMESNGIECKLSLVRGLRETASRQIVMEEIIAAAELTALVSRTHPGPRLFLSAVRVRWLCC